MFNPHFCYGRFVDKYKPVLPSLLLNEFSNIGFRFFFRLAHEPSPDFSLKKNPNSHYNTNLNIKYANRTRFLITWHSSTRDPTCMIRVQAPLTLVQTLARLQTRTQDHSDKTVRTRAYPTYIYINIGDGGVIRTVSIKTSRICIQSPILSGRYLLFYVN